MAMVTHAPQTRALYRRFLRELPARSPSLLANPSPIQQHIRADILSASSHESPDKPGVQQQQQQPPKSPARRLVEAEQYIHYLRAQRQYTTLLERYNPGMNMDEEERVRLSARRVGINLPVEFDGKLGEKE